MDRVQAIKTAEALVDAAYGTVPVEEYHDLEARLENLKQKAPEYTLREDYEIYVNESGEFRAHYTCSCEKCGFSFRFAHTTDALNAVQA